MQDGTRCHGSMSSTRFERDSAQTLLPGVNMSRVFVACENAWTFVWLYCDAAMFLLYSTSCVLRTDKVSEMCKVVRGCGILGGAWQLQT
eukprot:5512744-Amphidinium_carterae.1